jgi:hypothetical protein
MYCIYKIRNSILIELKHKQDWYSVPLLLWRPESAVTLAKSEQKPNNELTQHCLKPWYENGTNIIRKER